ncbi:MAG: FecCD family ABC transporter permease [Thermodesulfobacteriota bacterium]
MAHAADIRFWFLLLLLVGGSVCGILFSSGLGYVAIDWLDIVRIVLARITGDPVPPAGVDQVAPFVVMEVRLPRILVASLVGAGLAMSGVVYQGILLNPLADPYTLGISAGAAFGAALALVANLSLLGQLSVPLFAFAGAMATLAIVLALSTFNGRMSANTLILSGVIVGAILSAAISFLKYLADEQVGVIIFWLMGSFAARSWTDVLLVALAVVPGLLLALFYARDLNIMSLGARAATSLGVESSRVRTVLLVAASLVTAVCVSVSGIIGFVGLIVPHLMRFLVGPDNRRLLPVSFCAGAILLLMADTVTRAVLPVEVPIGVLTALIGGPFFCLIFRSRQRRGSYE